MSDDSKREPSQGWRAQERKRFKRKLTPFLCQEMLYEFATGQLDPDRALAIEEYLKTDRDSQLALDGIHRAMEYVGQLTTTELNPEIIAQLKESENAMTLGRRYSSWREWPQAIRWSATAVIASVLLAAIIAVIPWSRLSALRPKPSSTVEIAKIPSAPVDGLQEGEEVPPEAQTQGSGDLPPGEVADVEGSGDEHAEQVPLPVPTPPPAPTQPRAATEPKVQAPVVSDTTAAATPAPKAAAKGKSFVYRAFMNLGDLDTVGPKIAAEITALGGTKAGEVELGWKREEGRYYHFSLPEANEARLLERLRAYGPVRISKDPHPRVMPQGQVRFILWVDTLN